MSNKELTLVSFLVNPIIRGRVKSSLKDWMFTDESARSFYYILMAIDGNPSKESIISEINIKNPVNKESLIEYVKIIPEQVKSEDVLRSLSWLGQFIRERLLSKAVEKAVDIGLDKSLNDFKIASEFSLTHKKTYDFSLKQDREDARFEDTKCLDGSIEAGIIKSRYSILNDSLTYGGFKRGNVFMIVAPPKVGKTTFMICEGANFISNGWKVLHIFLGDMSPFDGMIKYITVLKNEIINEVAIDYNKYIDSNVEFLLSRVRIASFSAYELGVDDLVAYIDLVKEEFDFDVVVVDYDGNLQEALSDNLYRGGGYTYSRLDQMAKNNKAFCYVGSQPKIEWWTTEILPFTAAADSSKKQHAIDGMYCIGRNQKNPLIGTLNVPAVRRGISNILLRLKFNYTRGLIEHISEDEYQKILSLGCTDNIKDYFK